MNELEDKSSSRVAVGPLQVLGHFARILLAAGLLAGVLAGDGPARAQEATPAPKTAGEQIADCKKAAQRLIHEGKLAEARDELTRALALDPKDVDAHALMAAVAARAERWADALASYEKALAIGPARSSLYYGVGLCQRGLNDLAAARASLAKAIELGETELAAAKSDVEALRPAGNGSATAGEGTALAKAVAVERFCAATLTEASYQQAVVARELGDDVVERAALDRGLALAPDHAKLLGEQGSWLLRKGDAPGAAKTLERALASPACELSVVYDLGRALTQIPGREAEGRARLAEYVQRDAARRAKVSEERRRSQAAGLAARADDELREGHKSVARDLAARALELDSTNDVAKRIATAAAE